MKNKIGLLFVLISIISCNSRDKLLIENISYSDIDSIILENLDSEHIDLTNRESFKTKFKELKMVRGIWKFKPRRLIIKTKSMSDTILTDGVIFRYKNNFYMTNKEENILEGVIKDVSNRDSIIIRLDKAKESD